MRNRADKNLVRGTRGPQSSFARNSPFAPSRGERGYILLSLLFIVALLIIAAATAASSLSFTIRRDREEEMIHRGVEYSRAIRRYTKKTGRYPLTLDALENTNGIRFLRKRYKDPITGKDFKLLHMTDLQRIGVGGLGASSVGALQSSANTAGANATAGLAQSGLAQPGQAQLPQLLSALQSAQDPVAAPGQDNSASSSATPSAENGLNSSTSGSNPNSQPISGGVIVGVASTSPHESIREFNRKNHYKDWFFFYDPAYDRGFEIKGPTELTMPSLSAPLQQPITPGSPQPAVPSSTAPSTTPGPLTQ